MTGAQIPLSQLRSDAVDNLMGALTIAGHFLIPGGHSHIRPPKIPHALPECSVFFNHTLFRGNRVAKCSTYDLGAFNSPNFPPLVNGQRPSVCRICRELIHITVGIDIVLNWG